MSSGGGGGSGGGGWADAGVSGMGGVFSGGPWGVGGGSAGRELGWACAMRGAITHNDDAKRGDHRNEPSVTIESSGGDEGGSLSGFDHRATGT